MENFEKQFEKEEIEDRGIGGEFEKYKNGEKSFDELFAEMEVLKKEALKNGDNKMLSTIEEIGKEMQDEEIKRIEGGVA